MTDIQQIMDKMYKVLSDDGTTIHLIDLREHHTHLRTVPDKNISIDFLKYSTEEWNKMYPPGSLHYINRLRATDFRKFFTEAGFKIVDFLCIQKMNLDETIYDKIHPEFKRCSVADLSIINIEVILKKIA